MPNGMLTRITTFLARSRIILDMALESRERRACSGVGEQPQRPHTGFDFFFTR
ncbi:hypothetical protein BDK88_0735 [Natrinema hispanicum]|uniref:Uncharacterized protein n=1 Tax=Natrinema hispanicum TaxID=392421 RepID=A0A482YE54_9EURY|nr:hypothetical protein BDK88_0735 [Natrinema hispanicum]